MKKIRIFDADDTLWYTDEFFKQIIYASFDFIESKGVVDDIEAFKRSFVALNTAIFHSFGVAPSRWGHLLSLLMGEYAGLVTCEADLLELYNQIYYVTPKLKEGAI
jgi:hypothetical protein